MVSGVFQITQAADWPMFQVMIGVVFTVLSGGMAIILSLIGFMWKNIILRIDKVDNRLESLFADMSDIKCDLAGKQDK
ncbi:MAG: hypothetical protein DRJ03_07480 [Chloroflexi bacterium]|nr:MAG: hypothetical protein DRJ03_07480 [Chloroflexota bacterium]